MRWGLTWCLIAGLGLGSPAAADDAPTQPPSTSQLKWRVRPAASQRAGEQAQSADARRYPAKQVAAQEAAVGVSVKSSRARTRDLVMQVSSNSDPLKDPFDDGTGAKKRDATQSAPAADEPSLPKVNESLDVEPSPLPTQPGRSSEDAVPTPPRAAYEPLPPGEMTEGAAEPGALLTCDDNKADCLRGIADLQARGITKIEVALLIEGTEGEDYPCECKLGREYSPVFAGRSFAPTTFTWKATGVCHKPLYFEDVQLERYGHSWNPVVQPFLSAAHFFTSVALLPYNMGVTPPQECIYTLGYYRPGNCAPYMIEAVPLSMRGAMFEAAALTGFGFTLWP